LKIYNLNKQLWHLNLLLYQYCPCLINTPLINVEDDRKGWAHDVNSYDQLQPWVYIWEILWRRKIKPIYSTDNAILNCATSNFLLETKLVYFLDFNIQMGCHTPALWLVFCVYHLQSKVLTLEGASRNKLWQMQLVTQARNDFPNMQTGKTTSAPNYNTHEWCSALIRQHKEQTTKVKGKWSGIHTSMFLKVLQYTKITSLLQNTNMSKNPYLKMTLWKLLRS